MGEDLSEISNSRTMKKIQGEVLKNKAVSHTEEITFRLRQHDSSQVKYSGSSLETTMLQEQHMQRPYSRNVPGERLKARQRGEK